jgi:hypothetical protein
VTAAAVLVLAALAQAPAGDVAVRIVAQGQQSGVEEERQVVASTSEAFVALWRDHATPAAPLPAVDFTREAVVGLFLGTRPTAGYRVDVASVRRTADAVVVQFRERRPPADVLTAQVLTAPYILVAIPASTAPIRVERVP